VSGSTLIRWPTIAFAHETNASSGNAMKFLTLTFYDPFSGEAMLTMARTRSPPAY